MVPTQMPAMSHQQLWKTRRAVGWSPPETSMVISLPATVPKPELEKVSQVGMELTMIQSP